jgi:hypothetical protein
MRDFKGMKRQRSRNRNGGGGGGGGGGKPQHNTNRAFDSNGPEGVKVRGAAQHVYEKYQQLARDAQTSGDRVLAENYLQHAEHYFRLMRAMQPQRPLSEIIGRDQFVSGYDIDFEDEGSATDAIEGEQEAEAGETQEGGGDRPSRYEQRRDDFRQGDGRQGDARQRDDQPRQDRYQNDRVQSDRALGERAFGDRPAPDRAQSDRPQERAQSDRRQPERGQNDRGFSDRPREDRGPRNGADDRPRFNREDRPSRAERPERDPLGVIEPEATPLTAPSVQPSEPPMLRADDGEISHAPAFLQVRPVEGRAEEGEEPRRPRRRRVTAAVTADQPPAPSPAVSDET